MPAARSIVSIAGLVAAVAAQTASLTPLTDKHYTWPNVVSICANPLLGTSDILYSSRTKSLPSKSFVALNLASTSATRLPRIRNPTVRPPLSTRLMVGYSALSFN